MKTLKNLCNPTSWANLLGMATNTIVSTDHTPSTKPQDRWGRFVLIFSVLVLLWAMLPVAQHEYFFHDDYVHHFYGERFHCGRFPMAGWFHTMGRPLGHYIICLQFSGIERISEAWLPRLITVGLIAVLLVGIYVFLRREDMQKEIAALIAFGICILPGFLIFAYWLAASFILFSLLAALAAAYYCQRALRESDPKAYRKLIVAGVAMEYVADLIYQTGAMFIWVLAAIALVQAAVSGLRPMLRSLSTYGFVGAAANIGYLIWFTLISAHGRELAQADPSRGTLFSDLGGAMHWFYDAVLPRAARLWFVDGNSLIIPAAVIFLFLLSLALVIFFKIGKQPQGGRTAAIYVLSLIGLGLACFAPMLVAHLRLEFYRSLVGLSAFIFAVTVAQFWLIAEKSPFIARNAWIGGVMAIGALGMLAHATLIKNMIGPAVAEYQTFRDSFITAQAAGRGNWPVHVVVPDVAIQMGTDEVGHVTSNFPQDIQPLVNSIRRDLGEGFAVPTTRSAPGEAFDSKNVTVVNLAPLADSGVAPSLRKTGAR